MASPGVGPAEASAKDGFESTWPQPRGPAGRGLGAGAGAGGAAAGGGRNPQPLALRGSATRSAKRDRDLRGIPKVFADERLDGSLL